MAEALVAAPVFSAVFNVLFEKMASREVFDFFKRRKVSDKLLQKLKTSMNTVNWQLADVEENEIASLAVKKWVKDIAYETDLEDGDCCFFGMGGIGKTLLHINSPQA